MTYSHSISSCSLSISLSMTLLMFSIWRPMLFISFRAIFAYNGHLRYWLQLFTFCWSWFMITIPSRIASLTLPKSASVSGGQRFLLIMSSILGSTSGPALPPSCPPFPPLPRPWFSGTPPKGHSPGIWMTGVHVCAFGKKIGRDTARSTVGPSLSVDPPSLSP